LADRVTILDQGQTIICDTVRNLKDKITGGDIVEVELEGTENDPSIQKELSGITGTAKVMTVEKNKYKAYVSIGEAWVPKMTSLCYEKNLLVRSVRVTEPSLDDVFLNFTGRKLETEADA